MPYPDSPFENNFDVNVLINLKVDDKHDKNKEIQIEVEKTLKWLCAFPKITSYRVNTLKVDRHEVLNRIQERLDIVLGKGIYTAEYLDFLPDIIIINHIINLNTNLLKKYTNEVIVDADCGAAILRGAFIYAPGILGMISGTRIGDRVSIYVDLDKKCKKGLLKLFTDGRKVFVGNGIVRMSRESLFGEDLKPNGIAVEVTETISGCPPIGDGFLPSGWALLQNLPSIICVHILNPKENEVILDMCAAPGNKTTHIAALMKNKGILVAIDKTPKKLEQLNKTCKEFGAEVLTFQADSSNIVNNNQSEESSDLRNGPPFLPNSFDKILLDAPCSALGKRPQFVNKTSEKMIRSYVPLQRKLFQSAVSLLKPGGTLVYSTCTITLAENEGIVAWALKTFESLELVRPQLYLGEPGWPGTTLTEEEKNKIQRFGAAQKFDSVGFFIAHFVKKV